MRPSKDRLFSWIHASSVVVQAHPMKRARQRVDERAFMDESIGARRRVDKDHRDLNTPMDCAHSISRYRLQLSSRRVRSRKALGTLTSSGCQQGHRAVIVAVVAMGMVQVTIYQIVHVVAVGNGFVAASRSVDMV